MKLIHRSAAGITAVPNAFIDTYMPGANGEFVKVYLFLLRQDREAEFDVSDIADALDATENDVMRALRYWEKQGLLLLAGAAEGEISELTVLFPAADDRAPIPERTAEPVSAVVKPAAAETAAEKTEDPVRRSAEDEEFRQFLFVAETYLGRTLSAKDVQMFAYLYSELGFPEDLLEYLVEYCVEGGHRSSRYMESVALNWHREGKMTVRQAKEAHRAYSRENKQVMKEFGIVGRVLTAEERKFVERWTKTCGFSAELVAEACRNTMSAIHQPSFEYTDRILAAWKKAGVHTMADVEAYREKRRNRSRRSASGEKARSSRFVNYDQREIDYDALLKQEGVSSYANHS